MDFIKSWFGSKSKDVKPPKYDPSMDTPKDLPKLSEPVAGQDSEDGGHQQATYSPYSLPWVICLHRHVYSHKIVQLQV